MGLGYDLNFNHNTLGALVGGRSALDMSALRIQDLEEAKAFLQAYGFDIELEDDRASLWSYHRRAVTYLREELMNEGEEIPEMLSDPNKLKDFSYLLIYASTKDKSENSMQRWSCAILRVIHVLVHLENDLFTRFSASIQAQILKPIQKHIYKDPVSGIWLGNPSEGGIDLKNFTVKPFKKSDSSVTKLLAKKDAVAFTILDKLGVRFVTKHLVDSFRVMRYLVDHHAISLPHVISDQSNNTVFPVNIFLEAMESATDRSFKNSEEVDLFLHERLTLAQGRAEYQQKYNEFTSPKYRFIKFISRRMINVSLKVNDKPQKLSFFYPFEIQIMDYNSFLNNLKGEASHEEYKIRQRERARSRVLGEPSS